MNIWIIAAVLVSAASAAQAHPITHGKRHHHHAPAVIASYPDSVMLDGKPYKVCKAGMQDDCVEPRQAGLGFGNRPTSTYHPGKDRHR